jgi:hypothetical protein
VPPPAPNPTTEAPQPFNREDNTPPAWTPEDPVTRAAKSLADAFNGAIVDFGDDIAGDDEDFPPTVNAPF